MWRVRITVFPGVARDSTRWRLRKVHGSGLCYRGRTPASPQGRKWRQFGGYRTSKKRKQTRDVQRHGEMTHGECLDRFRTSRSLSSGGDGISSPCVTAQIHIWATRHRITKGIFFLFDSFVTGQPRGLLLLRSVIPGEPEMYLCLTLSSPVLNDVYSRYSTDSNGCEVKVTYGLMSFEHWHHWLVSH
jgi:hypothetical protein